MKYITSYGSFYMLPETEEDKRSLLHIYDELKKEGPIISYEDGCVQLYEKDECVEILQREKEDCSFDDQSKINPYDYDFILALYR